MAGRYGLEIRAAQPADAPGLSELFASAGLMVAARDVSERLEAMRGEPGVVLIAGEWGPPGGVVALSWPRTLHEARQTARIDTLLVAPEDRRRGIGRLLLKAGAQAARSAGCERLSLVVPPAADALRDFCGASGFAEIGATLTRPLRKGG